MSDDYNEIAKQLHKISRDIPDLKGGGNYPSDIALPVFEKIEALKPDVFIASDLLVRDQKLSKVLASIGEPAIPYLEHELNNNRRNNSDNAQTVFSIMGKIGQSCIGLLTSIYTSHLNPNFQILAAVELIRINENSRETVQDGLNNPDEHVRIASVIGFVRVIRGALWVEHFDDIHIEYTNLIIPKSNDPNEKIREEVLRLLLDIKADHYSTEKSNQAIKDSDLINILDNSLDDKDSRVRSIALDGFLTKEINSSNAHILAKAFEDSNGEICNNAIENMFTHRYGKLHDPDAIADAIINELIIRTSGKPSNNFNPQVVTKALQMTFEENPRLYSQTLDTLRKLSFDYENEVRRRSIFVAKRINEGEFRALVKEFAQDDPLAAREILKSLGSRVDIDEIADQISETDPSDVQQNASNQIKLLKNYYEDGRKQANISFWAALIIAIVGVLCLIVAIGFFILTNSSTIGILTTAGSIFTEVIAGTIFYLYNQARKQLIFYHEQINQNQKFLLANSLVESLDAGAKDEARKELIRQISATNITDNNQLLPK